MATKKPAGTRKSGPASSRAAEAEAGDIWALRPQHLKTAIEAVSASAADEGKTRSDVALSLNLSKGRITEHIQSVERQAGVKLYAGRSNKLTPEGRALARWGAHFLEEYDAFFKVIRRDR